MFDTDRRQQQCASATVLWREHIFDVKMFHQQYCRHCMHERLNMNESSPFRCYRALINLFQKFSYCRFPPRINLNKTVNFQAVQNINRTQRLRRKISFNLRNHFTSSIRVVSDVRSHFAVAQQGRFPSDLNFQFDDVGWERNHLVGLLATDVQCEFARLQVVVTCALSAEL